MNIENCICGEPILKENIDLESIEKKTIITYDCEECNYGFEINKSGNINIEAAFNIISETYKIIKSN